MAEGEGQDLVAEFAIYNVNNVTQWCSSCANTLSCLVVALFQTRRQKTCLLFFSRSSFVVVLLVSYVKTATVLFIGQLVQAKRTYFWQTY